MPLRKSKTWVIGVLLGAALGLLLSAMLAWHGARGWSSHHTLTLAAAGGLLGQSLWRNLPCVRDAVRAGQGLRVAAWVILATVVGGAMGLLAKFNEAKDLPTLLPDDPLSTWLIGATAGLLFALIGLGEEYEASTRRANP